MAVSTRVARRIVRVHGVVQGVGFRPFIHRLAEENGLTGFVRNCSGEVEIDVDGHPSALDRFVAAISTEAPPLARIDAVTVETAPALGRVVFEILESRADAGQYQPIAPDAATCDDCLRELLDASDRRYRYPFINCTNCGPRFTIIEDIPYDRPLTTMRAFTMCAGCQREYDDPRDRRYHAQPNACPDCGPRLWFADASGREGVGVDPIDAARSVIFRGGIVAVKGLGGFQLACDAANPAAVALLRSRKHRPGKPFAVMMRDLSEVRRYCRVDPAEVVLLRGTRRPIVLLQTHDGILGTALAAALAPGLKELGVMLPYTPIHHLVMRAFPGVLVMSSGNVSDEPICKDNADAIDRLGDIANAFLLHDRDIYARYDDTVTRVIGGREQVIRRSRGYCPDPIRVPVDAPEVLGVGAHLKNTFCLLKDGQAFVGPHIGDLDDLRSRQFFDEALVTYLRLFRGHPAIIACDLHPDYASTAIAEELALQAGVLERVQHHHAHAASVMAEHGLTDAVLAVTFDGLGYGPDGTLWGGELLACDPVRFRRLGHLKPVPQPGGDLAAIEGFRMAVSYLEMAGLHEPKPPEWMSLEADVTLWRHMVKLTRAARAGETTMVPWTTSAGRCFDAAASLTGIAHRSSYEGEAAMRLEAVAVEVADEFQVPLNGDGPLVIDTVALLAWLTGERHKGRPSGELAGLFHRSLASAIGHALERLSAATGLRQVVLSGGVFQNRLLSSLVRGWLEERDFAVFENSMVPPNDGGISLGQAYVAASRHALG